MGWIWGLPADVIVVLHVQFGMRDKVHAVLPVQRFTRAGCPSRSVFLPKKRWNVDLILFTNAVGHGLLLLRLDTRKLEQFRTRRPDRVWPVARALGLSYTTGDLVEEVGRGYGAIERG